MQRSSRPRGRGPEREGAAAGEDVERPPWWRIRGVSRGPCGRRSGARKLARGKLEDDGQQPRGCIPAIHGLGGSKPGRSRTVSSDGLFLLPELQSTRGARSRLVRTLRELLGRPEREPQTTDGERSGDIALLWGRRPSRGGNRTGSGVVGCSSSPTVVVDGRQCSAAGVAFRKRRTIPQSRRASTYGLWFFGAMASGGPMGGGEPLGRAEGR